MSIILSQIYVIGCDYQKLIEAVGTYLTSWMETKECLADFDSKDSEFFTASVVPTKSRFLMIIPGPGQTFTLTDSMRTCLDSSFANHLSRELQCKAIWSFVVGNTFSYSLEHYDKGDIIESRNGVETDGPIDARLIIDTEKVVFQYLEKLGIKPNLRFIYFDRIKPINRDVALTSGTSYMFQVAKKKNLFSRGFEIFGIPIQIEILNNSTSETVSTFPDFEENSSERTAIDNVFPLDVKTSEQIKALVGVLEARATRYLGAGYKKVVYIVPNGIQFESKEEPGQTSFREYLKSRALNDGSKPSYTVY